MIEAVKQKLQAEVEALNHELNVTLPETLKKAVALGDLKENGDYHAARERQVFVQARLSHLRSRLSKLSSIDLSKIPEDRVGLGSKLVVQDLDTKEKENLEMVIPEAMDFEGGQISVSSPIGRALLEKKPGETADVRLPGGTRKLKILELITFHQQIHE
jgi:transcription elongation factor GreA